MPSGSSKSKRVTAKRHLNPKGFSSEKLKAISLIEIKECIFDIVNHTIQDSSILDEDENFEHSIFDDITVESTEIDVFDLIDTFESCTDDWTV